MTIKTMETSKHIILGSNSPRRRELLSGLDIKFEVKVMDGIDETYPDCLPAFEVPLYLAKKKAEAYRMSIGKDELVITADTIVIEGEEILGKPHDSFEAQIMLEKLSGRTHVVSTGTCLTTSEEQRAFSVQSEVTFKQLSTMEIDYYISHFRPFDKAGAYGIQEWIGYVGVTSLKGSYYNVMGLPVQRIYQELCNMNVINFK